MSKILIAGYGYVGKAVHKLFKDAELYDPFQFDAFNYLPKAWTKTPDVKYDFCMVCVPTPAKADGSCDISAVEDVIKKIDAGVFVIRSTIPPKTICMLAGKYSIYAKEVVFQPEYVASSSPYPAPLSDIRKHPFIILGGEPVPVKKVRRLYESVYPPTAQFIEMTSTEAEICKYMENSFIATYVTFCNEFYDICKQYGADYDKVREGFVADPRITKYWTYVYESMRGWGGHCLPKDMASIIHETGSEFLKGVVENNNRHQMGNVNGKA